jgi:uncharacterized protein
MTTHERFGDQESTQEFAPISPARCQELLESQSVGRVAWQAADGPQILPVTYAWHDGTIIFRTSPYGVLSELVRPTDIALEIDQLDQESRQGWSVVVQGRAQGVAEPDQLVRMWTVGGVHSDHSPPNNRACSGSALQMSRLPGPGSAGRQPRSQLVAPAFLLPTMGLWSRFFGTPAPYRKVLVRCTIK